MSIYFLCDGEDDCSFTGNCYKLWGGKSSVCCHHTTNPDHAIALKDLGLRFYCQDGSYGEKCYTEVNKTDGC